jgi:hypothetical protein
MSTGYTIRYRGQLSPSDGVDAGDAQVFDVSVPDAEFSMSLRLSIDTHTNAVTEQFTGIGGDCLSTGFGSVWLSNHELGNVWRFSLAQFDASGNRILVVPVEFHTAHLIGDVRDGNRVVVLT